MNRHEEQQQRNHSKNPQKNRARNRKRKKKNTWRLVTAEGFPDKKKLENLISKSPDEIVQYLINPENGFKDLLKLKSLKEYIVLTIQAMCAALHIKNLKTKIKFCTILLQSTLFSNHFPALMNEAKKNHLVFEKLQSNLILISDHILRLSKSLPQNNLQYFVDFSYSLLENIKPDESDSEISKTISSVNKRLRQYTQNLSLPVESNERLSKKQIFSDFRLVSIYPTTEDLLNAQKPYLESIMEKGSYQDLNYYLAVHFWLMREDFISSLRTAFQKYLNTRNKGLQTRYENANFYKKVKIKKANSRGVILYKLVVKTNIKKDFHQQEILKNGNIICISSDNFKTIHAALIQNFEEDELPRGQAFLQIKCKKTKKIFEEDLEMATCFSALESPAFFESYRHVLNCLQVIRKGQLPFEQHIVHANQNIKKPAYVNSNASVTLYTANNQVEVSLSAFNKWPTAKELKLNISQMQALQLSLSHCLAIIQGPPGTGKTHIGLVILQTLLLNRKTWKIDKSPILIVCYTNHALDQFLEEVLEFNTKLVRVGSRSTSEKLAEFNLKYIRENNPEYMRLLNEITETKEEIKDLNLLLKNMSTYIFHENMLDLPYPDGKILNIMKNKNYIYKSKSFLASWLGVAFRTEEITSLQVMSYIDIQRVTFKEFDKNEGTKINFLHTMQCHFEFPKDLEKTLLCRLKLPCLWKKELAAEEMKKTDEMRDDEVREDMDLFSLSRNNRWRLYRRWITIFRKQIKSKILQLQSKIKQKSASMNAVTNRKTSDILKACDIVGMTTTGAARHYDVLKKIDCRIVIVEEAGEILESHTIACLNPNVQHLILIGDHKQLRPKPDDYQLGRDYRLDLSLFERLVNNNLPFVTLEEQHRMRPEISDLIRDEFYPTMKDHPDVFLYPDIRGVLYNVYFINHSVEEEEVMDNSKAYKNEHEAKFLVSFCEYLLHQDYTTKDISILTTYNGQLTAINNLLQKNSKWASNLRVSTVDNYQGEENDIILLSLVRSNGSGNVGFLKESNRVNVAFSRARHGLYVIGNLEFLAKNCRLWKRIVTKMKTKKQLGPSLPIVCQTHKNNIRMITHSQEFEEFASQGNCFEICRNIMPCGHTCKKRCHNGVHNCEKNRTRYRECGHKVVEKCTGTILNALKVNEECDETCGKIMECGHLCQKRCHDDDHLCDNIIARYLECGHQIVRKCTGRALNSLKVKEVCDQVCGKPLYCGHACQKRCHDGVHFCDKTLIRYLECGHQIVEKCGGRALNSLKVKEVCDQVCGKPLYCGHACQKRCHDGVHDCDNTIIRYCECGHQIVKKCTGRVLDLITFKEDCDQACVKILECGHKCDLKCHKGSQHKCRRYISLKRSCGHTDIMICPMKELNSVRLMNISRMTRCAAACNRQLPCGHPCRLICNHISNHDCGKTVTVHLKCKHTARLCKNRWSYVCQETETRFLSCGKHIINVKCGQNVSDMLCKFCSKKQFSKCILS